MLTSPKSSLSTRKSALLQLADFVAETLQDVETGIDYTRYAQDPVGFAHDFFGDTFAPDIIKVMESVRDNPVTVAQSATGYGKTHCAARVAVWFYKCHVGTRVYTAAAPPEDNLKLLLWGEIGAIVQKHASVFGDDKPNVMHISRGADEFITGVTIPAQGTPGDRESRFSGKHAKHILFIVDEGDAVPDEIYRAIDGGMSGGHARLLIMFNPRNPRGAVYKMVKNKQANVVELNAFNHPNVIHGKDLFPGAVTRDATIRRINTLTRPLATEEEFDEKYCFAMPPYLVGQTAVAKDGSLYPPLPATARRIIEPSFFYVVLGKYPPASDNQLISEEWTDAARARWDLWVARYGEKPPQHVRGIGGADIAEVGNDLNALAWRYGGWVPSITTWGGIDVIATGDKIVPHYNRVNPSLLITDATGLGAGVAPYLRRKLGKINGQIIGCKVAEKATERPIAPDGQTIMGDFGCMRDQLWWSIREWLRTDPAAMLPPDEELLEELLIPTYSSDKTVKIMSRDRMVELLGRSPDRASALALTFYPAKTFSLGFVETAARNRRR